MWRRIIATEMTMRVVKNYILELFRKKRITPVIYAKIVSKYLKFMLAPLDPETSRYIFWTSVIKNLLVDKFVWRSKIGVPNDLVPTIFTAQEAAPEYDYSKSVHIGYLLDRLQVAMGFELLCWTYTPQLDILHDIGYRYRIHRKGLVVSNNLTEDYFASTIRAAGMITFHSLQSNLSRNHTENCATHHGI